MGWRDLFKAAIERPIGSTRDLTAQATALQAGAAPAQVPDATRRAMQEQGMGSGAFSPGEPIAPYRPVGTEPIISPYPVGYNIYAMPRGMTGVGFDTLKSITSRWDVARLCIEVREDELRGLDWEIVADDDADADKYAAELKAARRLFEHPSPGQDFDDLQMRLAEDWLRYDALVLAPRRSRAGKVAELEALDGTTISPLVDGSGRMPRGNAPAYVQWAYGLPWTWLTATDVIYKPHHPRPETRYGLAPTEWVLLSANTDLRLQWYFLTYFTEGEVPEAFINAPPDVQDPKQVKALQDAYSAVMSGARAAHHKIKWIPAGASVHAVNKGQFDVAFAGFILAKACAAYKVQPAEIGFTEKVNKSSGQTQADVTYRRSIKPSVQYFESIWNRVLRDYLNMPYARFKYMNIEEEEDQLKLAQTRSVYIQNAVLSPDEVRAELGYEIDPDAPVGRGFATRTGIIFVDAASQQRAREAGTMAQQAAGTAPVPSPNDNADSTEDDPAVLNPNQTIVDPALKPIPPKPGKATEEEPQKAIQAELRKWREVAIKRAKQGKPPRAFTSDVIPSMIHTLIEAQLQTATTPEMVKAVFAPVLGGGDADPLAKRVMRVKTPSGPFVGLPITRDDEAVDATRTALQTVVADWLAAQAYKAAQLIADGAIAQVGVTSSGTLNQPPDPIETARQILEKLKEHEAQDAADGETLDRDVKPHLESAYHHGVSDGGKALHVQIAWDRFNPKAVAYATQRGAELVGKKVLPDGTVIDNPNGKYVISEATREMIRAQVVRALTVGSSPDDLMKALQSHYAFSAARAETIARTETALAYNRGVVASYRQALVTHVEVLDGDYDEECQMADGQIWTLEEAEANPVAHPNCVRAFSPLAPDEGEAEE